MANKNVLIHEKDDKFLKALKLYFRGSDWDPETADSTAALSAAARRRKPNVVLVAIENDNGEARDLLRHVTGDEATRGVPIVVMSTRKSDRDLFAEGINAVGAKRRSNSCLAAARERASPRTAERPTCAGNEAAPMTPRDGLLTMSEARTF